MSPEPWFPHLQSSMCEREVPTCLLAPPSCRFAERVRLWMDFTWDAGTPGEKKGLWHENEGGGTGGAAGLGSGQRGSSPGPGAWISFAAEGERLPPEDSPSVKRGGWGRVLTYELGDGGGMESSQWCPRRHPTPEEMLSACHSPSVLG